MPDAIARRGAGAIAGSVSFQLLPYRVEVTFDDDAMQPVVRSLANQARQPVEPRAAMSYHVGGRGPYEVLEEGDHLATAAGPDDAARVISERCQARLVDYLSLGQWGAIRGGIARVGTHRTLVVSELAANVEPLLLQLVEAGHTVEGNDLVFFRGGEAVCVPRSAAAEVDLAPVDVVCVLRGAGGGTARCWSITTVKLVQVLVAGALPWLGSPAQLVRAASTLVAGVDAYELSDGDVRDNARVLAATCASAAS